MKEYLTKNKFSSTRGQQGEEEELLLLLLLASSTEVDGDKPLPLSTSDGDTPFSSNQREPTMFGPNKNRAPRKKDQKRRIEGGRWFQQQ